MDSRLHRRARAAPATGLAAAIFIGGVLAAPAGAAAASPQLPFWAAFSGSAAFTGPSTSAFLGSGYAGLLGRISTDGDAAVTGVVDSPCAGGLANTNIETLTSANG